MSQRVIISYQGYSPELEEELYFATRRRPNQSGENIVVPKVDVHEPDVPGGIHHPKEVHQQHRFLSYDCAGPAEALALASALAGVVGVENLKLPDMVVAPPAPPADAPAAPAAAEKPITDADLWPANSAPAPEPEPSQTEPYYPFDRDAD